MYGRLDLARDIEVTAALMLIQHAIDGGVRRVPHAILRAVALHRSGGDAQGGVGIGVEVLAAELLLSFDPQGADLHPTPSDRILECRLVAEVVDHEGSETMEAAEITALGTPLVIGGDALPHRKPVGHLEQDAQGAFIYQGHLTEHLFQSRWADFPTLHQRADHLTQCRAAVTHLREHEIMLLPLVHLEVEREKAIEHIPETMLARGVHRDPLTEGVLLLVLAFDHLVLGQTPHHALGILEAVGEALDPRLHLKFQLG